jgi:AraC-like DNA-binding protein
MAEPMTELSSRLLLDTGTASVWDVVCPGGHAHGAYEECAAATHLVFPYRGLFVSHVGRRSAVMDSNQLLFINEGEPFRMSHPVAGGDACLSIGVESALLDELIPKPIRARGVAASTEHRRRIDPQAQRLAGLLRHRLASGAETLQGEELALTLASRALGARTSHRPAGSWSRQRLVDRTKLVLAANLARRWALAEIGAEVGASPVYLTQLFQQVEGVPLYRYQLRLRLSHALDLLPRCDDLTMLGLDLGFSSHSHFSAAFRRAYGQAPTAYRHECRARLG